MEAPFNSLTAGSTLLSTKSVVKKKEARTASYPCHFGTAGLAFFPYAGDFRVRAYKNRAVSNADKNRSLHAR